MKKRILAALVAVAMVFSVCTIASADGMDDVTPAYSQDFEGTLPTYVDGGKVSLVEDPTDPTNTVLEVVEGAEQWGSFVSEDLPVDTQGTTYTIVFKVYGSVAFFGLTQDQAFWQRQVPICGEAGEVYPGVVGNQWKTYVYTYENTWGRTRLCGQVQSGIGSIGKFYVDDVKIYEGDYYDDIVATLPTPEPVPEETPTPEVTDDATEAPEVDATETPVVDEPTATPDVTDDATEAPATEVPATEAPVAATTAAVVGTPGATTAPTAVVGTPGATTAPTATPTTNPTKKPAKKVTIKFKKKSVKIKKGKKVTLKVTLKNAKKATFSVNKKGKKVVKLSKKKAKSVVVKGKKKGKATITAKAKGKKATCKVTVKK